MRSAAHGAIVHALMQLWSHYPLVDLQRVVTRYARGMDANKIARLEDEVEELDKMLAEDVELFSEGGAMLCRLGKTYVESLYNSA